MSSKVVGDAKNSLKSFQHWRDPGVLEKGFERWDELRAIAGRSFGTKAEDTGRTDGNWWYLLDYEDILEAFRDFKAFPFGEVNPGVDIMKAIPGELDPPEHGKYRNLLVSNFSPAAVRKKEPEIRALAKSLIDGFCDQGECDFMIDYANKFPTGIFLDYLDLPMDKLPYYADLMETITDRKSVV